MMDPIQTGQQWMRQVNKRLTRLDRHRHPNYATTAATSQLASGLASALQRISALEYDTGWIPLTLDNSWTNTGGFVAQIRRVHKTVQMTGRVVGGTGAITTLLTEFRPLEQISPIVRDGTSASDLGVLSISSTGVVTPLLGLTTPNLYATWLAA